MGASDFCVKGSGKTAKEAFNAAVEDARYEHGHSGYTGTIAEKDSFKMISVPDGIDPVEYAYQLLEEDDDRIADKWGSAGCIKLGDDKWLFFGYASS
jgi:hypothetical protein